MKQISLLITVFIFTLFLASCNKKSIGQPDEKQEDLLGKKLVINYPEFKANVEYNDKNNLHWIVTQKDGAVKEGFESISYKKIAENIYFVNWIEDNGFTVSQVIDFNKNIITVFGSYDDKASKRGGRSASFFEGNFEINYQ